MDYTDLLDKKQHRQVAMGTLVTPWKHDCQMLSTLAQNTRDVGSIPTLGAIFPIFINTTTILLDVSKISHLPQPVTDHQCYTFSLFIKSGDH